MSNESVFNSVKSITNNEYKNMLGVNMKFETPSDMNLKDPSLESFIKKYENYEYGASAGSKGENNEIDCSGLVCKFIESKGKINQFKDDLSSQGIWLQSKNQKSYNSVDEFTSDITNIKDKSIIAFSTGDTLSDNRKYGIDHVGMVVEDKNGIKYILESSSSKGGVVVSLLKERVKEIKLSNRKGKGVIFTGTIG